MSRDEKLDYSEVENGVCSNLWSKIYPEVKFYWEWPKFELYSEAASCFILFIYLVFAF